MSRNLVEVVTVTLRGDLDEEIVRDVRFWSGLDRRLIRRQADGWSIAIELPAVLEVLDEITAGHLDPAEARDILADLAAYITDLAEIPGAEHSTIEVFPR